MSQFTIETCTVGAVGTNCYLVYCQDSKRTVVIDPGAEGPAIIQRLEELSLIPEAIVLTHGHFDHITAVRELLAAFDGLELYAGEKEKELLAKPEVNLSAALGTAVSCQADHYVKDGETLTLAGMRFHVMETPGHTAGSICLLAEGEGTLFSGDTLFLESVGRTDLPTADTKQLVNSIRSGLFPLPDDTRVYPGHGAPTTIGHEKAYNPVALGWTNSGCEI